MSGTCSLAVAGFQAIFVEGIVLIKFNFSVGFSFSTDGERDGFRWSAGVLTGLAKYGEPFLF